MRIGVIGAGRRVQGNYLPALNILSDLYQVEWVHARRPKALRAAIAPWGVAAQDRLDADSLERVDAVAISVPIDQNAAVLRQLQASKTRLHLFIDTPIVTSMRQAKELMPLLRDFKTITVTEDFMNSPEWVLARDVVNRGKIGFVSDVILDGSGYYYHALALIRSFFDRAAARTTRRMALGGEHAVNTFEFGGGRRGRIVYPYRRFDGVATIIGADATISTWSQADPTRPVITLMRHRNDAGLIDRITLKGSGFEHDQPLSDVAKIAVMPDHDRTDLNLMRTLGLATVFRSLHETQNVPRYDLMSGLYDSIVSRRANRKSLTIDPLAIAGTGTLVDWLLR